MYGKCKTLRSLFQAFSKLGKKVKKWQAKNKKIKSAVTESKRTPVGKLNKVVLVYPLIGLILTGFVSTLTLLIQMTNAIWLWSVKIGVERGESDSHCSWHLPFNLFSVS